MSTHFDHHNLSPRPPEAKRSQSWREKTWLIPAVVGMTGLLVGIGIAGGGKPKPADPAPSPAVTVTATASPAPTVTKTVDKEVPVTPDACLKYIDLSETAFSYSGEAMGYMSSAMKAAARLDVEGVRAASSSLDTLNPKLSALTPQVNAAKADCRSSAK